MPIVPGALTPGLELWRQEDSKGRLLALVQEGGALCLAPRYAGVSPLLKGELRDFLLPLPQRGLGRDKGWGPVGLGSGGSRGIAGSGTGRERRFPCLSALCRGEGGAGFPRPVGIPLPCLSSFPEKGEEAFRAYYARGLGQGRITSLGFWRRGELVAAATVTRYGDAGILENLAVDPSCQGKGLGRVPGWGPALPAGCPREAYGRLFPCPIPFLPQTGLFPKGGFCLWKA